MAINSIIIELQKPTIWQINRLDLSNLIYFIIFVNKMMKNRQKIIIYQSQICLLTLYIDFCICIFILVLKYMKYVFWFFIENFCRIRSIFFYFYYLVCFISLISFVSLISLISLIILISFISFISSISFISTISCLKII